MKQLILICICFFGMQTAATAGSNKSVWIDQLPEKARVLIDTHFSGIKISYAKMDKELFDTSYEVVFTNGTKIEFNRKGNWIDIECRNGIPEEIIPVEIMKFIHEHHPGLKVIKVEHDRSGYEVKLINSIEMKFDRRLRMRGYLNNLTQKVGLSLSLLRSSI